MVNGASGSGQSRCFWKRWSGTGRFGNVSSISANNGIGMKCKKLCAVNVQSFPYAQTCLNFCKKALKTLAIKDFA